MTTINDLEDRIKDAEAALDAMKTDLEHLKQQEQPEPESLFGRWATHPNFGRGIIISDHEDRESEVEFAYFNEARSTGAAMEYVPTYDLTIDPAVLTTEEDYQAAPDGTLIEDEDGFVWTKRDGHWYAPGLKWLDPDELSDCEIVCRVIRWGTGA